MKPWKRVEPTVVHKIGWRTLVRKHFIAEDGSLQDYVTYEPEGQAYTGVIAITKDAQVLIAEQYRTGPEKVMQDIPGGGVEGNESFEQAAGRELNEETGYTPELLVPLGSVYKDCKSNAVHHYFLATGCTRTGEQRLDDNEFVNLKLISIDELLDNAKHGRMTDVEAVFLAYDHLQQLKL